MSLRRLSFHHRFHGKEKVRAEGAQQEKENAGSGGGDNEGGKSMTRHAGANNSEVAVSE